MATYEFVCQECGHQFELFVQGFLKDGDKLCPECASTDVRQKFASFLRNFGGGASADGCSRPRNSGFG